VSLDMGGTDVGRSVFPLQTKILSQWTPMLSGRTRGWGGNVSISKKNVWCSNYFFVFHESLLEISYFRLGGQIFLELFHGMWTFFVYAHRHRVVKQIECLDFAVFGRKSIICHVSIKYIKVGFLAIFVNSNHQKTQPANCIEFLLKLCTCLCFSDLAVNRPTIIITGKAFKRCYLYETAGNLNYIKLHSKTATNDCQIPASLYCHFH
jgi:hypothetical protein